MSPDRAADPSTDIPMSLDNTNTHPPQPPPTPGRPRPTHPNPATPTPHPPPHPHHGDSAFRAAVRPGFELSKNVHVLRDKNGFHEVKLPNARLREAGGLGMHCRGHGSILESALNTPCLGPVSSKSQSAAGRESRMKSRKKSRSSRFTTSVAALAFVGVGIATPTRATADDQYFYVVNQSTNKVAEVFAHEQGEEKPIVLWTNYGGESEQFRQVAAGDGWFALVAKHSGKCLGRTVVTTSNKAVQDECGILSSSPFNDQQLWRMETIPKKASDCANPNQCFGGSRTVLHNKYGGGRFCLDAANAKAPTPPVEGAPLQAWPCIKKFSDWNAVNQDWQIVRTQDWGPGPNVH